MFLMIKVKPKKNSIVGLSLVFMMCFDVWMNAYNVVSNFRLIDRDKIIDKETSIENILKDVQEKDKGLFRFGDSDALTPNDGMAFGYLSVGHHSSAENLSLIHYLQSLGYPERRWNYRVFYTQNIITDALFGIKYITPVNKKNTYYPVKTSENGLNYQLNPFALPLIFVSDGKPYNSGKTANALEAQKALFSSISSCSSCISLLQNISNDENILEYLCEKEGPVYLNFQKADCKIIYQIGESEEQEFSIETEPIPYLLGIAKPGEIIRIYYNELKGKEPDLSKFAAAQVDIKTFSSLCSTIQNRTNKISRPSSNILKATVTAGENDSLYITIPYSDGWVLTVDGNPVEIQRSLSYFMGAELSPGTHEIELIYHTPGLFFGSVISRGTLTLFIMILVLKKARVSLVRCT